VKVEDKEQCWCVYMHTSPSGKKYVGITSKDTKERWKQGSTYKGCVAFQNAINKYKWENFEHQILYSNLTEKEAKDLEISLISEMDLRNPDKGYNISPGGDAFFKGGHHTDEAKIKISRHNSGKGNPMYGKPRPIGGGKPSKKVINLCTLNVYESQHEAERCVGATLGALNDVILGRRISMLGDYWMDYDEYLELSKEKTHEEIIKQFDERVKEHWKKAAANKRKGVVQLSISGEFIIEFESIACAENQTGINHSAISRCCRFLQTQAGGYKWMYTNEYYKIKIND
jgi:group I intron endonuclease